MRRAPISALAEQIRGVSYSRDEVSPVPQPGYLPVLRAGNITDTGLVFDDLVFVPEERISAHQRVRRDDVIIAASSGSLDVVGKAARALEDYDAGFGAFCKVLRPGPNVDPAYFAHFFQTRDYRLRISALAAGISINNLRNEHLDRLEMSLPSRGEQRRIAEILDRADALRAKRRAALAQLDTLIQSIFFDMFGNLVTNDKGWRDDRKLGDVAHIVSGVTKGRILNGKSTRAVPYLAVANVQERALSLDVVKTIEATEDEITRYRLRRNDLLLTEGGDPDKLGRGSLWTDQLPECIHQNHIFRVRITSPEVEPVFLNWLIGSERGKRYFLRSAKQTTGIASINMTQLRGFPLLVPPIAEQMLFAERVRAVANAVVLQAKAARELDALFASLQHRAFRGELLREFTKSKEPKTGE